MPLRMADILGRSPPFFFFFTASGISAEKLLDDAARFAFGLAASHYLGSLAAIPGSGRLRERWCGLGQGA